MSANVRRIVLLSRFTTLVGPATGTTEFVTDPFPARMFCHADIVVRLGSIGAGIGGGSHSFVLQESPDLLTWMTNATLSSTEDADDVTAVDLDMEWLRLKVSLSDRRFTCYVVGDFVEREG
jgi:hypothetical protein